MKVIIADTSCLIIYHKIGQLEILRDAFSDLIVTKEVAEEFGELPDWLAIKKKEILTLIDKTKFRISQSIREKILRESGELE